MMGALDITYIYIFWLLNEVNECLMLPRNAGDKILFSILQDELGIETIGFKMANLEGVFI